MKGLLRKDFAYIIYQKKPFFIVLLFALFVPVVTGPGFEAAADFACGYISVVSGIVIVSTIAYDEMDNGFPYLMSMPVSRSMYVNSKYILALLGAALGILLSLILFTVIMLVGEEAAGASDIGKKTAVIFFSCLMISSVGIPANLKFGGQKGNIVMIAAILAFIALCSGILKLAEMMTGTKYVDLVIQIFSIEESRFAFILITVTIVCILISYAISRKIMEHKEF